MELDHPLPVHQPAADISVEGSECRVVPGETARFPFVLRTWPDGQSVHDLDVVCANPRFNRSWAHIVESSDGAFVRHYTLEIHPTDVRRHHYGTYPLLLTWGIPGTLRYAESRCVLVIGPCVRLTAQPALALRPAGRLSLALENCGDTGLDVCVTLSHHGSSWSRGWKFELGTGDGPFEFSEEFDLPRGARKGEFELGISAEGIPITQATVRPRRLFIARKHIVTAAAVLAAAALAPAAAALTGGGPGPSMRPQEITFTTVPPAAPVPGSSYAVAATGGGSGNAVTFRIDPPSAAVCSVSGSVVTFRQAGLCVIDANEAGDATYQPAQQAQQVVAVAGGSSGGRGGGGSSGGGSGGAGGAALLAQGITFTSEPPASPQPGGTYDVTATGGGSDNAVTFSIDPPSAAVCSVSGSVVTFSQAGLCVIDANQAGDAKYQPAQQVAQTVTVTGLPQTITFTSAPQGPYFPDDTYKVAATGGGSDNAVTFSIDPPSAAVCSVSGSVVTFSQAGLCVIDANQAGDAKYQPAQQVAQTVTVASLLSQAITFTSTPQTLYFPGDTYAVTATGGGSGNPVIYSIDSSGTWPCSVSGSTVTIGTNPPNQGGTCVIDANQAAGGKYQAAPQVQQRLTVRSVS